MEKILTLHPAGKKGVNIDREKYDAIKVQIPFQEVYLGMWSR